MKKEQNDIIIYTTVDGKASVSLMTKDGNVWMNQTQLATLFDTSKQNISQHILKILKDNELQEKSVVKNYLTTAQDGENYEVTFYSLDMILAIGFRVEYGVKEAQQADQQNLEELKALEAKIKKTK